jgi:hypothetical protein
VMASDDRDVLAEFRSEFYRCLDRRADAAFELTDAVLCHDGPVSTLVGLSLAGVHRRGHGALYDAVNCGSIDIARLRRALTALPLPRDGRGRILLAVDVSNWLRPDAATSPDRLFCHTYARGKGQAQMIPGWPYSFVAALESGRTSWTRLLDAVRIGPHDDPTTVTATQLREVVDRVITAGQWRPGDPDVVIVLDSGYDVTRLAWLLEDLPVELVGRVRSDRVFYFDAPPTVGGPGRPRRHGPEFKLADTATWPDPPVTTATPTSRYGQATVDSWNRLHPRLTQRGAWAGWAGPLPVIAGTVIRLSVEHLPGDRNPKPVWLWSSRTDLTGTDVDRLWQSYLRRFDLEHTFRFLKQTLGWTRPRITNPEAADHWTRLVIAAHTQLGLARGLARDLKHPWEKPSAPSRLTPARVRRGFRNLHRTLPPQAGAPKPSRPGPGRPPGRRNRHPAPIHPCGKQTKKVK